MNNLKIKRIYKPTSKEDGYRILVDKLWPRGISKERANLDKWAKEITPSDRLRKEFCHKPEFMKVFRENYLSELDNNEHAIGFVNLIKEKLEEGNVTLLYAAKDEENNHAIILREWIESML